MIPTAGADLDESHSGLGKLASVQTLASERVGVRSTDTVRFQHAGGFTAQVHQFRDGGLHFESHLVAADEGFEIVIHWIALQTTFVESPKICELQPLLFAAEVGRFQIGDWIASL